MEKEFRTSAQQAINNVMDKVDSYLKRQRIKDTLSRIGLDIEFIHKLQEDSDWAFIIKAHAVIEAQLNQAIVDTLGESRLSSFAQRLDTSNPSTGKVAVLYALGIINKPLRSTIIEWSALRNKVAHDIHNINFSVKDYVSSMDKNQRRSFDTKFGVPMLPDGVEADQPIYPRLTLHLSVTNLLIAIAIGALRHSLINHPESRVDFYVTLTPDDKRALQLMKVMRMNDPISLTDAIEPFLQDGNQDLLALLNRAAESYSIK